MTDVDGTIGRQVVSDDAAVLSALLARMRASVRWLLVLPPAGAIIGVALAVLLPSWWTAKASFVPEQSQSSKLPSGLGGLAGQLGISIGSDASQSPRFYVQLLSSRTVLVEVLADRAPRPGGAAGDSVPILQLLGVSGRSRDDSLERAIKKLTKQMTSEIDPKSSIVSLEVQAKSPALAADIAARALHHMAEFNAQSRQTQAHRRRVFLEGRVEQARSELRTAEERLTSFYRDNRSFVAAPDLRARDARLQREVQVAQEVYLSLQRNYETARIDEVNDVPAVTVIDPPVVPARRTWPITWLFALLGALLGGTVAAAVAVGPLALEALQSGPGAAGA